MLFLCLLTFISCTSDDFKHLANDTLLSFVEYGDDRNMDMLTISANKSSLFVLMIKNGKHVIKKHIFSLEKKSQKINSAVVLDFNGDGKLDVLLVTESTSLFHYLILWDIHSPSTPYTFDDNFKVEPFIVSESERPFIMTVLSNGTVVLYKYRPEKTDFIAEKGFGPVEWATIHCNHQISLNYPTTVYFFTTPHGFEIWEYRSDVIQMTSSYGPPSGNISHFGQSSFYDIDCNGVLVHLLPVCLNETCEHWQVFAHLDGEWVLFLDFPDGLQLAKSSLLLRTADLNLDGLSDLILPPMMNGGAYLLRHLTSCAGCITTSTGHYFTLHFLHLDNVILVVPFFNFPDETMSSSLIMAQGGVAPALLMSYPIRTDNRAFFSIEVVISQRMTPLPGTPVRIFQRSFQSSETTTTHTLLSCFSHHALQFPIVVFGLGANPQFVSRIDVAHTLNGSLNIRTFKSLIPNSHALIIVGTKTSGWKLKIFITYGKSIIYTGLSLGLLFMLLVGISMVMKWREMAEDAREKYSEERRKLMSSSSGYRW